MTLGCVQKRPPLHHGGEKHILRARKGTQFHGLSRAPTNRRQLVGLLLHGVAQLDVDGELVVHLAHAKQNVGDEGRKYSTKRAAGIRREIKGDVTL